MYENQSIAKNPYLNGASTSSPQYGGDCALAEDGLASSTKRLQEVTGELYEQTLQLRQYFGVDSPPESQAAPRPSGHKADIDGAISASRAALDNLNIVIRHLNS